MEEPATITTCWHDGVLSEFVTESVTHPSRERAHAHLWREREYVMDSYREGERVFFPYVPGLFCLRIHHKHLVTDS